MVAMSPRRPTGSVPWRRAIPPVACLLAIVMLAACTDTGSDHEANGSGGPKGSPASLATQAPLLPATVDQLPTTSVEGFQQLMDQLRGTPVVVNVWASWCEPCKAEAPRLSAGAAENPHVQFLGVDAQDARDGGERFIANYAIPYPSLFDPDGSIRTELDAFGMPVTVFYAADGSVAARVDGELSQQALDENLAAIATRP
jgi:cytochrome c biogenesis protein CcmG, thiol:disulfide interchange protein DsbE